VRLSVLPFFLISFVGLPSWADAPVRPDPALQALEWINNRPEQRQALDNFYRSLQQQQMHDSLSQRELRLQRLEQLRDMTPEQRQQNFLDFVQKNQAVPVVPNR